MNNVELVHYYYWYLHYDFRLYLHIVQILLPSFFLQLTVVFHWVIVYWVEVVAVLDLHLVEVDLAEVYGDDYVAVYCCECTCFGS